MLTILILYGRLPRKITLTGFYRNNILVGNEVTSRVSIFPGEDVSAESKKVKRIVAQAHVPTVVDRYNAQVVYDNAVIARVGRPTQTNIDAEAAALVDLNAKIQAYDLFEA